jgi:hypothetical protein
MNLARALTVTALAAGALYVSYLCILYFMQHALIYPGTSNRVDRVAPRPEGADLFHISTADANVEALFLPAAADANATRQAVVIFAHGNVEVIGYWVSALRGFQERGVGGTVGGVSRLWALERIAFRAIDSGGHGCGIRSPGCRSPRDPHRIFGFGQSLGGGAVCLLAKDRPLRALILQSTFTSLSMLSPRAIGPPASCCAITSTTCQ